MAEMRGAYGVLMGNPTERDHFEDIGTYVWVILKLNCKKWN